MSYGGSCANHCPGGLKLSQCLAMKAKLVCTYQETLFKLLS
jgi:hypothetical protein